MLPYTRGTRIPRLLGVRDYLNHYIAMYKRLTRSRITVELASPAHFWLRILQKIILPCIIVRRGPVYAVYVTNSSKNYFAMYNRQTWSGIRVELASPAYLGFGIIK